MKAFAMFEKPVDVLVNVWSKRVCDDASKPQCSMTEFTSPLKPAHQAIRRNRFADAVNESLIAWKKAADELAIFHFGFDFRIGKLRSQRRIQKPRVRLRAHVQSCLSQSRPNTEAFHSRHGRNK